MERRERAEIQANQALINIKIGSIDEAGTALYYLGHLLLYKFGEDTFVAAAG